MVDWSIDSRLNKAKNTVVICALAVAILAGLNVFFQVLEPPSNLKEVFQDTLLNWFFILGGLFASGFAIASSMDFLTKYLPWKKRIDERITHLESGIKPDLYYSYTHEQRLNKEQSEIIKEPKKYPKSFIFSKEIKILTVFLVLGIIIIFLALWFNAIANQDDRVSYRPWQAFQMYYTTSYRLNDLRTTVILNENNEQYVGIYYSVDQIQNDNPFIALVIPYTGQLRYGDHHWLSKSLTEGGTLIYKQFSCNEDKCNYHRYQNYYDQYEGNDQYNLLFEINGKIDSNRAGDHSLKIPINGALDRESSEFVQFELAKGKVYSYSNGFSNITSSKFAVSLPEDISELDILPNNFEIRYENFPSFNKNKTVFEWNMPKDTSSFHLGYTYPSEKIHHETFSNISTIFTGVGITFIITGIAEYVKGRIESKK